MISARFTHEVPRIGVEVARNLITAGINAVEVEISNGHRRVATLIPTSNHNNGTRWWWVCPRCGRRRAHLYLVDDVICRECAGIKYASQYLD